MKFVFLAAVLVGAASCASSADAADTVAPVSITTRLCTSTTTFSCNPQGLEDCHYLILHSLCQERIADGRKERHCLYTQAAPPFQIGAGQTRTVANLQQDFLYTMKIGSAPTVDDVLRAPLRH